MASPASAVFATENVSFISVTGAGSAHIVSADAVTASPEALSEAGQAANLVKHLAGERATTAEVSADRRSVHVGESVRLTGQVTYGSQPILVRNHPVTLQVRSGDAWHDVATDKTSNNGYVVFSVRLTSSSTYRLSYPGVLALGDSISGGITISATSASRASAQSAPVKAEYAPVAASGRGAQVVQYAAAQTGKPYRYAAAGPNAFDCSGLTQSAFASVGVNLPHNADAQKGYGVAVSRANAQPGDLIIFTDAGYGYHVAIYAGGGLMYDAPNPASTVGKRSIYGGTVIFRRLV
jgi:cell wall-associated NlpC family hydrolase